MSYDPSSQENGAEDDPLIAAQKAFLSGGSQPAAKVIRSAKSPKPDETSAIEPEGPGANREAPEWYKQMKGVRFQLDDLERNETKGSKQQDGSRQTGSLIGDIVERKVSSPPVFSIRGTGTKARGFPAPRSFSRRPFKDSNTLDSDRMDGSGIDSAGQPDGEDLMKEIDRENREKLAEMSEEEILSLSFQSHV